MTRPLPLVSVRWLDAKGDSVKEIDADNIHQWHRPHTIITFGLLIKDDEVGVTLMTEDIGSATKTDDYRGPTLILRSLIQEMWLVSANPYKRRRLKKVEEKKDEVPDTKGEPKLLPS